jgi:hypothetical protein
MSVIQIETQDGVGTVIVSPPPNDQKRYALVWDHGGDTAVWYAIGGGYGTAYGQFYGGDPT